MIDSDHYVFEYLFFRGFATSIVILSYLFLKEKIFFLKNFHEIKFSILLGGIFLCIAFVCFIFSITKTIAAVTLCMLAVIPFMTAILAYFILNENLSNTTFFAISLAAIGIFLMILNDLSLGSASGALFGLLAALGFSCYAISVRWKSKNPKFLTVALAGIICTLFSFSMCDFSFQAIFSIPKININLSLIHGAILGIGFIFFSLGAKYLPATDLTFLTLLEVVGGIFWVWLPIFGVNEKPTLMVLIGGIIILFSIFYYGYNLKNKNNFNKI